VDYELNELRREFLDEAREKVREMQNALDAERDSAAIDRLAYLAHQLKGSGGSYGYAKISSEATTIEKEAKRLVNNDGGDPRAEERIQQSVVNLRAEIERSAKELATATPA